MYHRVRFVEHNWRINCFISKVELTEGTCRQRRQSRWLRLWHSPMVLEFYQYVHLNKPNKFSNYLENQFGPVWPEFGSKFPFAQTFKSKILHRSDFDWGKLYVVGKPLPRATKLGIYDDSIWLETNPELMNSSALVFCCFSGKMREKWPEENFGCCSWRNSKIWENYLIVK